MTKHQKLALEQLKKLKQEFESKKYFLHLTLFNTVPEYAQAFKQKQTLLIEASKHSPTPKQTLSKIAEIDKELDELTSKHSDNAHILDKEFMCNKCLDKGFLNLKPCSCLKQIQSQMLIKQSGLNLEMLKLQKHDLSIFSNQKQMQTVYKLADKWVLDWQNNKVKNWGFFGNTGTGKTYLMLHMLKKIIENGHFAYFTTAFNLTKELLSQHTDFDDKNRDYISKYLDCDVLFIDDMGTEPKYNNVNENYMYLILNQRTLEGKPIIFSSNFDLAQFEDFYGERIFSRLVNKRTSKLLWFDGSDLRFKK